jgi:hypothetical protein
MNHFELSLGFALPVDAYVPEQKIREIAEAHLTIPDDIYEEHERKSGDMSDRDLIYCGAKLTPDEVRKIYDKLDITAQKYPRGLALKFVELNRKRAPHTTYNFDDGLVDVARVGMFLSGVNP